MEDHINTGDRCQSLVINQDTGEPAIFMWYDGVSPFCPSYANEGSKWVVQDFRPGFGYQLDPTITIECTATGIFTLIWRYAQF